MCGSGRLAAGSDTTASVMTAYYMVQCGAGTESVTVVNETPLAGTGLDATFQVVIGRSVVEDGTSYSLCSNSVAVIAEAAPTEGGAARSTASRWAGDGSARRYGTVAVVLSSADSDCCISAVVVSGGDYNYFTGFMSIT